MHRPRKFEPRLAGIVLVALTAVGFGAEVRAQSLEPRAYSNSPTGLNFVLAGFQNSNGAIETDPALPIDSLSADVSTGYIGYVRTLEVAGNSAKLGVLLPYASLQADGFLDGVYKERDVVGLADPTFFFSYNFHGAPALSVPEFKDYRQEKIIGVTLKIVAPLGDYDSSKLMNISTNRWTIEPGIGISSALGNWTLETSGAAAFYTDNNDFFNGKKREQDPIYSAQFHVTYTFPSKMWLAASTTYYEGGKTTIDSIERADLQENWRTGITLSLPLNRNQSVKLYGSRGVSTRTGSNFDLAGVVWQYRWGGGF